MQRFPLPPTRLLPVTAGLLGVTLLTACGSGSGAAAGGGAPRSGGTLTLGIGYSPDCVDPQQTAVNVGLNVGRQVVDSLIDQDPRSGEFKPWLAESWEADAKATAFTFKLREGATFSDGTPVDAAAVKANFDNIVKLGAKAQLGASYLGGYKGTTVVDPATVKIEFRTPSAQFLQAASTMSLGLLSPKALASGTPEQRCQGVGLIGSGPFTVQRFQQKQEAVLVKRRGYDWGSALWSKTGEAYLDKVVYRIIPEAGVRTGALASGQVDAITDVQPADERQVTGNGREIKVRANPGVVFNLGPNTSRPTLSDVRVRTALTKGIDRKEIVDTVLSPSYRPATGVLATVTPDYAAQPLAYDPEGAKKLLDEAGWKPGPDGIRAKDGRKLSVAVTFFTAFGPSQSVLELAQQQLRKVGVDLQLKLTTSGELARINASGDYDLIWYNITRADPDVLRTLLHSKFTNRARLAPGNDLDGILDEQAAAADKTERAKLVADAQKRVAEGGYVIPIHELTQVIALGPNARGIDFEASSRLQLHNAWVAG